MERYIWSINGVKYENAEPIRLKYGERVRFKFVNQTMMTHPMHLHGMWSILDTGAGTLNPVKHTVSVAPGTTLYMETEVDATGEWIMHCHLPYHAAAGMFRRIVRRRRPAIRPAGRRSGGVPMKTHLIALLLAVGPRGGTRPGPGSGVGVLRNSDRRV